MKRDRICLVLFLVFFASPVLALNIGVEKYNYLVGEEISVFGECEVPVEITVFSEKMLLYKNLVDCDVGAYRELVSIDFTFPTGKWLIQAKSKKDLYSTEITVKPTRESSLLDIKIHSPARKPQTRASMFVLNAEVSYLGEKVSNGSVHSWLPNGEKISLTTKGNGFYETAIDIPYNFAIGDWQLVVTAQHVASEKTVGGQRKIVLPIAPAEINLEIAKPKSWIFVTNVEEEIILKPLYSNGENVKNPEISASIGNKKLLFEPFDDNAFRGKFLFSAEESGPYVLDLAIKDSANNTFSKKIDVFVEKSILSAIPFFSENAVIVFSMIFILIVLLSLFYFSRKLKKLSGEVSGRQIILDQIKKLETDYFINKSISKDFYDKEKKRLESKLSTLEKKIVGK